MRSFKTDEQRYLIEPTANQLELINLEKNGLPKTANAPNMKYVATSCVSGT